MERTKLLTTITSYAGCVLDMSDPCPVFSFGKELYGVLGTGCDTFPAAPAALPDNDRPRHEKAPELSFRKDGKRGRRSFFCAVRCFEVWDGNRVYRGAANVKRVRIRGAKSAGHGFPHKRDGPLKAENFFTCKV